MLNASKYIITSALHNISKKIIKAKMHNESTQ